MPDSVGDYLLEEPLSDAGGARVWRARDARGRPVRLRVSDPEAVPADRAVRAFERLTAALTRWGRQAWPGVETPVGTVLPDAAGRFALATEWLDGQPALESLPEIGVGRLEATLRVASDVARTLQALHAAEAVHGAVAAHNVWVSPQGAVLLSFWWSQANLRDHPGPAAPESIASGRFDALADQWAWGRLLRTLLPPGVEAPGDLEAIITRATEPKPSDRFPSMTEAVAALGAFETTLRTDDVHRGPEAAEHDPTVDDAAATVDLGARRPTRPPEASTEDMPRPAPDEARTEDLGGKPPPDADRTAPPDAGPPGPDAGPRAAKGPLRSDPGDETQSLRVGRAAARSTPLLLWTVALGMFALGIALLLRP